MERSADRENTTTVAQLDTDAVRSALASSGMVAFLVALALLFIATAPPT